MTQYEWACQWKTLSDGEYDRIISHHPGSRLALTEEEARNEVRSRKLGGFPARLVCRAVTPWEPAA